MVFVFIPEHKTSLYILYRLEDTDMENASIAGKQNVQIKKKKKKVIFTSETLGLYLLLAPAIILLFVFSYIPMYGILIAFEDFSAFKGIFGSKWVGLYQFKYFLTDPTFWKVLRNTLVISLNDLLYGFAAPIIFALLANEIISKRFKKVMQTISYLPHFLSWVVIAGVFYQILSPETGIVNKIIVALGGKAVFFTTEPKLFVPLAVFTGIWAGVGWGAILYFSVIAGIDQELYGAAMIDGANRWQQAIHVTLPGMVPMIVLLLLLNIAGLFGVGFDRIFCLQNSLTYDVSDVISTYLYRIGIKGSQYSLTTAIGLVQSILSLILLTSANKLSGKLVGMGLY